MNPWPYLGSRKHFAGCAMMLVAIGLALSDPVGPQAVVLVAAFYLAGVLAVPGRPQTARFGFDPGSVERRLAATISAASGRVPPEVMIRLRRIELLLRAEILPRLDRLPPGTIELYLVRTSGCEYIPAALDAYFCLPPGYVSMQPGTEGQSALSILLDELGVVEARMRSVATTIQRADMDRLLAHRRFLHERLRQDASG